MDKYVLGVDLGGTKIALLGSNKIGMEDAILRVPSKLYDKNCKIEETLVEAVEQYIRDYEDGNRPLMVGFGLKDYVSKKKGIWYAHPTADGMEPIDFVKYVREKTGLEAVLDNDVHAATLAEIDFGAGRRFEDFLYINIGTGLSIGIVSEGRLLRGSTNYSGEAGHITVETDGDPCSFCGKRGCLEHIVGGGWIVDHCHQAAKDHPDSLLAKMYQEKGRLSSRDLFAASDMGDEVAVQMSERIVRALVTATADLVNIFNPEALIFGGGVMSDGWLLERLKKVLFMNIIKTDREALREISLSDLGSDHVGVLGTIVLARQELAGR